MALFSKSVLKKVMIIVHDLVVTAAALTCAFFVRFDGALLDEHLRYLPVILPPFVAFAGLIYWYFALYQSKWRFASLPDLANIIKAVSVLAIVLLVADYILVSRDFYGFFFFGKITIALYWLLQISFLGGPRLAYRALRDSRARHSAARENSVPTLLLGRGTEVDVILRAIEARQMGRIKAVGIVSPRATDVGLSIRGVRVLGTMETLEQVVNDYAQRGVPVRRLVAAPSALAPEAEPERLLSRVRKLALPISRLASLDGRLDGASLAPLEIEDLLLRPTVEIDRERLESFIGGKRVAVTGGGGSIGSEICDRVVALGASELLIIESSEPALHAVTQALARHDATTKIHGCLADVRDRPRLDDLFARQRPDIVFHAAALKHVPYLEQDWGEGVKTNVFGSLNVAEAAVAAGVDIVVMISTDKAIEPVSMLGATKRMSEMVAQALDAQSTNGAVNGVRGTRLIAVRFGNVLGSNGSVVPLFKRQIAHGGPVTVTHPDMVRYFMTVREAADLVLTAGSHADREARSKSVERTSVYVLKMGQPVRILDLAERMIRIAGFEPGTDIEIAFSGVRPGERLNEILFAQEEPAAEIGIDGVMAARPIFADRKRLDQWLEGLRAAVERGDRTAAERLFEDAIPDFAERTFKARKLAGMSRPEAAPILPVPQVSAANQG